MGRRRTWARSNYYKRLDDGRYEVGFLVGYESREEPSAIVDTQQQAFWWVWNN